VSHRLTWAAEQDSRVVAAILPKLAASEPVELRLLAARTLRSLRVADGRVRGRCACQ
jgi:hypothetical protein